MSSQIDPTTPVDGVPAPKALMRANFSAAKTEIEALQIGKMETNPDPHDIASVWRGTQAEYDALGTYEPNWLYVIVG